jgi:hypothetical protein
MNNIELRQLDTKDKYENENLVGPLSNYINMFINLLIEIIKLITSTFNSGEEVCRHISAAIIIDLNVWPEVYTVYKVQWDKGSHKLFII